MEEITVSKKKRAIKYQNRDILYINISFPVISNKKFERINRFYRDISDEFLKYCETKLKANAEKCVNNKNFNNIHGASISCVIPYCDENFLSVILDFSYYDGVNEKKIRKSQNWVLDTCLPFSSNDILKSPKKAKNIIKSKIKQDIEFSYKAKNGYEFYPDIISIALKKFDFGNFYLTEKGFGFFYQTGVLSDLHNGFSVFIVPFEGLKEHINEDFMNLI